MKKLLCFVPALMIAAVILILIIGSQSIATSADSYKPEKTYESILIENQETLWGLAENYAAELNMGKAEYVKELKSINGLTSDKIIRGTHLIIICAGKTI